MGAAESFTVFGKVDKDHCKLVLFVPGSCSGPAIVLIARL